MSRMKWIVLLSSVVASAALAQSTPPSQLQLPAQPEKKAVPAAQGQTASPSPGSQSTGAGAGQTSMERLPGWVIPAAVAAAVVGVAVIANNDDSPSTPPAH